MKSSPNLKLRKILNDLKRRPEDAAKDLGISKDKISKILSNKLKLDNSLLAKATPEDKSGEEFIKELERRKNH